MIEFKLHRKNFHRFLTTWTPGVFSYLAQNRKTIVQIIIAVFFIGMGIYFVKHERGEFAQIQNTLNTAQPLWVLLGIAISSLYIALQALMYVFSFKSIHKKITFQSAILLFLKRNFISVFLPAGGVS